VNIEKVYTGDIQKREDIMKKYIKGTVLFLDNKKSEPSPKKTG